MRSSDWNVSRHGLASVPALASRSRRSRVSTTGAGWSTLMIANAHTPTLARPRIATPLHPGLLPPPPAGLAALWRRGMVLCYDVLCGAGLGGGGGGGGMGRGHV